MLMWCGIDWAEHHHDVAVIDEAGQLRARLRIGDDAAGFTALLERACQIFCVRGVA
jgi:transposase